METWISRIQPINIEAGEKARNHIDQLTKPLGSLGRLEETAIRLAEITGNAIPDATPPGVIVFAADHGIAEEGVSAFPKEVTSQEPGHKWALELLQKKPLLDLHLRLGEGSGAAVAFPLVEAAARMMKEMATFSSAGLSEKA